MPIYMKLPGAKGSVTAKDYKGCALVDYVHFSLQKPIAMKIGTDDMRGTGGRLQFSYLTLTKPADLASNFLMQNSLSGDSIDHVEIFDVHLSAQQSASTKYILKNVRVAHFEKVSQTDGLPQEYIRLAYTAIEHHHIPHDESGVPSSKSVVGFDLVRAAEV